MDWLDVPHKLPELFVKYAAAAREADKNEQDYIETDELGRVYLKTASAFKPVFDTLGAVQKPFGGPNPMLSMLLGGALGAGLGYGGASLMSTLMPERYFDKQRLKRNWALLGAAGGAALPGYFWARPAMQLHGVKGLFRSPPPTPQQPYTPKPNELPAQTLPDPTKEVLAAAERKFNLRFEEDELFQKAADAGAMFAPVVPVDRFNRVVLGDPYTPPPIRAATAGLTSAASLSQGGIPLVSPADIAKVAIGMGSGVVSGLIVGKALGALGGLRPEAQERLQQAGAVAGLLKAVVPMVFK